MDRAKHRYIETQKGVVCYEEIKGNDEKSPMVFLHDALGSIGQWKHFPRRLCEQQNRRGIIIERYGHGQSGGVKRKPLSHTFLEEEAEDLRGILSKLNIKSPILIGSSDGGSIALIYGARYSAEAIVSIAGHYFNEKETQEGVESMKKESIKTSIVEGLKKYHGPKAKDLVEAWQEIWTSERFQNWDISEMVSRIPVPVMVIQGIKDDYASDHHAISLAKKIGPHAELLLMEDLGHFPHLEAESETLSALKSFLQVI